MTSIQNKANHLYKTKQNIYTIPSKTSIQNKTKNIYTKQIKTYIQNKTKQNININKASMQNNAKHQYFALFCINVLLCFG
jgi:hypothetical protein